VEATRGEARWNATLAWLDLWEAQERARLLADAATEAARVATIADEKFKAGSAPRVEVLRTGADRERARADASLAAALVPAAAARLAIAVGPGGGQAWVGPVWVATGKPDLALADVALAALQWPSIRSCAGIARASPRVPRMCGPSNARAGRRSPAT
jgi:outer membrane protein TolC